MPHATSIEVCPFPRTAELDLGAEIKGADLNNLDGKALVPASGAHRFDTLCR